MCQSHPGPEITQEYLNSLAALANYTLPTPAALQATTLPNGWEPVPGEVPAPYKAELYTGISDAEGGEGTRRRSTTGENGRSRNLVFPPAPEPLPYPIVDNHTHMDLLDGEVEISARDALDAGEKLGIGAIVQVGCDIPPPSTPWPPPRLTSVCWPPSPFTRTPPPELAAAGQLETAIATLDELATADRVRAIGETGLDYFRTGDEGKEAQHYSFREHIRLAKKHNLALQIHDRDAHEDVVRILDKRVRRNVPCSTATRVARSLPRSAMSAAGT